MRIRMLAAVAVAASAAVVGMALPASARSVDQNGRCEASEGCFYYNGNLGGSLSDFFWAETDFAQEKFLSAGAGKGQHLKNNAASARNTWSRPMVVYYNENFTGPSDRIPAHGWRNLVNTWNDNASFTWL